MSYRFLFKLLELIKCSEAEFAELGRVLLLLGELLGVSVQEGVKVRGNTSIFRAGRTALSQRLEEGNDSYSSKNSIVTLFSCFNLTISLPWEIRNSFKVATSLLISFLNFSSMSSFGIFLSIQSQL